MREAEIISQAGKKGAVTVATNMAGRGVDIVLGGEPPKNEDGSAKQTPSDIKAWEKANQEVKDIGGLYVIGTERHESRRIDNQLRGRSGRQGDPGASRFFVALDDDIMRLFGGDRIAGIMTRFNMPEDVPLEHPWCHVQLKTRRSKLKGLILTPENILSNMMMCLINKEKLCIDSDEVFWKRQENDDISTKVEIQNRVHDAVNTVVDLAFAKADGEAPNAGIVAEITTIVPFDELSQQQLIKQLEQVHAAEDKKDFLNKLIDDLYEKREEQMGPQLTRQIERFVMLQVD